MSSVVVSGDSSSPSEGQEGNPIELDDSSTNSGNSNSNSEGGGEIPPGPLSFKKGKRFSDHGDDSGGENESSSDESDSSEDDDDGGDDDSGEDGDEESSEVDGDDEMNIEESGTAKKGVKCDESENKMKREGGNDDCDGESKNSASKGPKDDSPRVRGRVKSTKNLWGNIESMSEIIKSPYEGNECAEVGEDCFEEFRALMDCSENNGAINPRMVALVGDKLARDLCNAHHEIGKSGMLYSPTWKEGKIRDSDFGWIPRRQLLLCLHEHRFAKGNVIVLQSVTKNLDCTKLVLESMKLWDLMEDYPNLSSNKNEETFVFGPQRIICYKCQIFVARAFATLQILNNTEGIKKSLSKKIKACLSIMNEHVRANQIELARIRKKVSKRKALQSTSTEEPDDENSTDQKGARSKRSGNPENRNKSSISRDTKTRVSKPKGSSRGPDKKPREPKPRDRKTPSQPMNVPQKRQRKIPKREEREESIFMLFNTMHMQVQRLNQMMSFFQSQLQDHRYYLREEIRKNLEKDGDDNC